MFEEFKLGKYMGENCWVILKCIGNILEVKLKMRGWGFVFLILLFLFFYFIDLEVEFFV